MSFEYENGFAAKLAWTWAARPSLKIMTRIATEGKEGKGAMDGCAMDAAHFGLVGRACFSDCHIRTTHYGCSGTVALLANEISSIRRDEKCVRRFRIIMSAAASLDCFSLS